MQPPLFLPLLFTTLLLLFLTPAHAGPNPSQVNAWRRTCLAKSSGPQIAIAISQICSRDFQTGTPWAQRGKKVSLVQVKVESFCQVNQFVPRVWCEAQFFQTCAEGGRRGYGQKYFNSGCQGFDIIKQGGYK